MVDGVSNYSKNFPTISRDSRTRSDRQDSSLHDNISKGLVDEPSLEHYLQKSAFEGSLDIKLDMSKSMQILESESRRSISQSFALEFNLTVDFEGKIGGSFQDARSSQIASTSRSGKDEKDPYSAENTANRIIDFVKRAADLTRSLGISNLENEDEKNHFETLQLGAVKEGFKQARSILGNLDRDRDDRVNDTYALVMDGLDRYFHPENYEDDDSSSEEGLEDLNNSVKTLSASQNFSLNFQLSMNGEGVFNAEELHEFVEDAFSEVKNLFEGFLWGKNGEESFNPLGLFQLDRLSQDRVRALVED